MYNLRVFSFPNSNSKEYRMYKIGVVEDRGPFGVERKKWHNELDEKGNRVSFDDEGNYRSQEDTDRCFYESRKRSKNMILEYARANNWEWFITLTFNPDMVDSYNYDLCYKRVSKYFNNLRSRKCPNLKYLLVPEQHPTSGRWHFHGLISNVHEFSLGITKYKGCIYHIDGFKYGFTTATKVKDTKRVSSYISKYITKEVADLTVGRNRYIKSNNLDKADVVEYNISSDELEALRVDLVSQGAYFKEVERGVQKISYFNIDE